jgi:hypothetical protein
MCPLFKATHLSIAIGQYKIIPVSKAAQHVDVHNRFLIGICCLVHVLLLI